MTAIFMLFSRNGKRFRKRKTEITGNMAERRLQMGGLYKQGKEKI